MTDPISSSPSIRGLTYPLSIENGNLSVSSDLALVTQQIRSIIETRYYERVMRAEYGIGDYVLEIIDPAQINSAIQYSIHRNVKSVTALNVRGDWVTQGDDGIYRVFIEYSVDGVPQPPLNFALAN